MKTEGRSKRHQKGQRRIATEIRNSEDSRRNSRMGDHWTKKPEWRNIKVRPALQPRGSQGIILCSQKPMERLQASFFPGPGSCSKSPGGDQAFWLQQALSWGARIRWNTDAFSKKPWMIKLACMVKLLSLQFSSCNGNTSKKHSLHIFRMFFSPHSDTETND